jgi:hypothetical protein
MASTPIIRPKTRVTKNRKSKNLDTSPETEAIPLKPKKPAIKDRNIKNTAHFNIYFSSQFSNKGILAFVGCMLIRRLPSSLTSSRKE